MRPTRRSPTVCALVVVFLGASACKDKEVAASRLTTDAAPLDRLARADFNRLAAELALPLFWVADTHHNGTLDPDALAVYWGLDPQAKRTDYVGPNGFTPKLRQDYARLVDYHAHALPAASGRDADEMARRAAVLQELAQGRPALVATDLSQASAEEKRFVERILAIATQIEDLYAIQRGTAALKSRVPADDPASRTLFFRAQGPKCAGPLTQHDPHCSAIPGGPLGVLCGMYPTALLSQPKFCEALIQRDKALMDPFVVVGGTAEAPQAVPYTAAYKDRMDAIADNLQGAAAALGGKEHALQTYLRAASRAFRDNNWWPADEAWAQMNALNSKYYLRIAPDEVYGEPCSTKALFHVSFGLINQASLAWQAKLDPFKTAMEESFAALAGPPYAARAVSFKLPDFFDVALNAGDARTEFGATIGQSLPNFGPVANEGRGRTVVMTNLYQDADNVAALRDAAASLLCASTMAHFTGSQDPMLMSTVLHEAAHNLGPAHQYKVDGKTDREIFTGPVASMLEELKAQSAALFFSDWLVDKGALSQDEAVKAHVRDIVWAFGHISRGMYTEDRSPQPYSQLAAIQLGVLVKGGALTWAADTRAANGHDMGCFALTVERFAPLARALLTDVAQIKATGDKVRALALIQEYVGAPGETKDLHPVITERMLRQPKASFVYAIKLDG